MKFDIFFSICQTEVDGYMPSEKQMLLNFFDQAVLADDLGYETAWVAETHLSCQTQKENSYAVIPHFKGEIGLNTDILQVAHLVMAKTKKIKVGSAIRNILCNGGPIAHAEAVRTFLSLNSLHDQPRTLELGFAAGRFPFSNHPYGVRPRSDLEQAAWDQVKGKWFASAAECFVRLLRGEQLASKDLTTWTLRPEDFRQSEDWQRLVSQFGASPEQASLPLSPFYDFEKVGVIPFEAPLENLSLTIGSHDPETQAHVNRYYPVGVFNLSITPSDTIEETHQRMQEVFHPDGGAWSRSRMPRTLLLFLDRDSAKAKEQAQRAWENYWKAMEKTLDPAKVAKAVGNAIAGTPEEVISAIREKYHPEDRLMLWFDFNNHDNEQVKASMRLFMDEVAPHLP